MNKYLLNLLTKSFWFIFLLFIIAGVVLVLSPYLLIPGNGHLYFSLKPYFLQIFGSKGNMWVFLAFLVIPLQEIYKIIDSKNKIYLSLKNAQIGLSGELKSNMDSIFSPKVDEHLSFFWYERVNSDLLCELKEEKGEIWDRFVELYKEIYWYRDMVKVHWHTTPRYNVGEYQYDIQLNFLTFLDMKPPSIKKTQHEKRDERDKFSKKYINKNGKWKSKMQNKLNAKLLTLFN